MAIVVIITGLAAVPLRASDDSSSETNRSRFHLGFSLATFTEVNENDAKAAMKVWAHMLLQERGLPVDPEPVVMRGLEEVIQALRDKRVDAVTLNTDEYWRLDTNLLEGPFIAGLSGGRITEEYLLLVHKDGQIDRIESLRGRRLNIFQNSRMCLAAAWLDTILHQAGFPPATQFCQTTRIPKLAQVVLPVFFRQVDACLVTRRGFQTLSELNPQVGQRLMVLAASPEFVPTGFCFRRGYDDPLKDTIVAELSKIKDSPAGIQLLTLFQSGSLEAHPLSCLDNAFQLLATHQKLCQTTNGVILAQTNIWANPIKGDLP